MKNDRFISFSLRLCALASRLGFFIVLALFLSPSDLGLFGLVSVTVTYSTYFLGLDFYIIANREIRIADNVRKSSILKHSLVLYCIVYVVVLPLTFFIFVAELLPFRIIALFYAVLILEHLAQECYRVLVVLGRPLLASFTLFLRLGLWAILVSVVMALSAAYRSVEFILLAWAFGAGLALSVGLVGISFLPSAGWSWPISWSWIWKVVKKSLPFLFATLCLRGIVTFDRYWIETLTSAEILGVYVLFVGIASTLPALLEAGLFAFISPKMLSAVHEGDNQKYSFLFRKLCRETIIATVVFGVIAIVSIQLLLWVIDNPIYSENIVLFYLCLIGLSLFAISMIFHFGLYSYRRDYSIIGSHIGGLCVFIMTTFWIGQYSSYFAVPTGLIAGYGTVLLTKAACYLYLLKSEN